MIFFCSDDGDGDVSNLDFDIGKKFWLTINLNVNRTCE